MHSFHSIDPCSAMRNKARCCFSMVSWPYSGLSMEDFKLKDTLYASMYSYRKQPKIKQPTS